VRRAAAPAELPAILDEFRAEGPGAVVVQRFAAAAAGRSVRVIVTGGCVGGSTERSGAHGEWRSNIARGGTQRRVELTAAERDTSLGAVAALGLGHAGVDLLRLPGGSIVLEVNACPDFTSMLPHVDVDLAAQLVRAAIQLGA
jgi:glutathione synthase/RimK-type ligase-like ATP-grasp enzyme